MLTLSPHEASRHLDQLTEFYAITAKLNLFINRPSSEILPLRSRRLWLQENIPAKLFRFADTYGRFSDVLQKNHVHTGCTECDEKRVREWFFKDGKKLQCTTCANCDAVLTLTIWRGKNESKKSNLHKPV
jgi:hypothetical protein